MNYEKEYKKLKAGIKNAYLYAQTDSTKAVLENILPELRESEDERIRKSLRSYLRGLGEFEYPDKETYNNWLAWLEKQGEPTLKAEQSDMQNLNTWSEEDENILNNLIAFLKVEDALQYDWKQIIIWLKSLKERIGG